MLHMTLRHKAAAFGLAAVATFVNAATLGAGMSIERPAPLTLPAGIEPGCDVHPLRPC